MIKYNGLLRKGLQKEDKRAKRNARNGVERRRYKKGDAKKGYKAETRWRHEGRERARSRTHHAMNDSVLSEQDDLPRRRDGNLLLDGLLLPERNLSESGGDVLGGRSNSLEGRSSLDDPFLVGVQGSRKGVERVDEGSGRFGSNGSRVEEGVLEVVDEIVRVLDTDAESNEIFGESSLGSKVGGDRGVTSSKSEEEKGKSVFDSRTNATEMQRRPKKNSPHQARHTDQTVHSSETDTDPPDPRSTDDSLAQNDVARLKTHDSSGSGGLLEVNLVSRIGFESRVVNLESESVKVGGDEVAGGLLTIHSEREGFD